MKNFEELVDFIKKHPKNYEELLKKPPYNLKSITMIFIVLPLLLWSLR